MALGVVGPLADPLRAIDQALLDVVADVPPRLVGKRGDLVEGEFLGGAHGLLIRQYWWRVKWRVLFATTPCLGRPRLRLRYGHERAQVNRPLPRNKRRADDVVATQANVLTLANCRKDRTRARRDGVNQEPFVM